MCSGCPWIKIFFGPFITWSKADTKFEKSLTLSVWVDWVRRCPSADDGNCRQVMRTPDRHFTCPRVSSLLHQSKPGSRVNNLLIKTYSAKYVYVQFLAYGICDPDSPENVHAITTWHGSGNVQTLGFQLVSWLISNCEFLSVIYSCLQTCSGGSFQFNTWKELCDKY